MKGVSHMKIINIRNLNFEYPGKRVLHDISFAVDAGSVTALVGPNGAGKTTLMRCLVALEKPQSGAVVIDGMDVAENPRGVRAVCGYLSDFFGLYDGLKVRQCLIYGAWSHGIAPADIDARVAAVAGQTGISGVMEKPAGTLSRGYRQRVGIALALLHDPKILVLDEPASGMDPEARIALSGLMRDLRAGGKTVLVSSHILNELEDYCTDMLVIRDGRLAEHVVLKDHEAKGRVSATLRVVVASAPDLAAGILRAHSRVAQVQAGGNGEILCSFSGSPAEQAALLRTLVSGGAEVVEIGIVSRKLQDVYVDVIGHDDRGAKK